MVRAARRASHGTSTRIRRTRRLGAFLMAGSLAMGTALATLTPAVAQEGPTAPDDAEPVEVTSTAYWTYPVNEAAPATLTSEFPPGLVCLVRPEACPESLAPVSDGVEGALGEAKDNEPNPPEDPVPPDSLPVGIQNGAKRYEAAARFEVPTGGDEQIDRFIVVLTEKQPTYHSSSPIFRQAVLSALSCYRECDQQEEFQKILASAPAESATIGVEACPYTAAFEEGRSQTPPADGQKVDCLYGGNGVRVDGTDGIWLFDLTFAAQAWADGTLPNNGVLFRPTGAPNLAYGDPDATTSAQATFEATAIQASMQTSPAPEAPAPFAPAPDNSDSGSFSGSSGGFSSAPSGGISSSDSFSSAPAFTADEAASAPQVAEPAPVGAEEPVLAPVAGVADEQAAGSAWWMWLLVPIFAAGSWMTAQSLTAEVALGAARERTGAMTRLIARNHGEAVAGTPMTQV